VKDLPTQSPLLILKAEPSQELSVAEEQARRQRIVGNIEALRAQLASQQRPHVHAPSKGADASISTTEPRGASLLRRHWRWGVTLLPVAAALMVWLGVRGPSREPLVRLERGQVTVETRNGPQTLSGADGWDQGNEVMVATDAEEATLVLPSHAAVRLDPRSVARIARTETARAPRSSDAVGASGEELHDSGESVHLQRGAVVVGAGHAREGETVRVYTEHARVVVRGTLFAVLVETGRVGGGTHVSVRAGEARIWSDGEEHVLKAGQEWSSRSAPPASSSPAASGAPIEPSAGARVSAISGQTDAGAPRGRIERRSNELGKQNELFAAAQAARRAGQSELALRRFEALMRLHPGSEQAHNARVEHFRLLASLGRRAEAIRSARAYLRSYPRGFAAAEAERSSR
jgi:FecR protein